jgi:polysaccharide export outer membrane protein
MRTISLTILAALLGVAPHAAAAQSPSAHVPAEYVIGPDDQLSIVFWREKDMTTDVVVRPDGKISLPRLNEITAGGRTPDQLREAIAAEAGRYFEDPTVAVIVKQINSRKVFITGQVEKPGPYLLTGPTTVIQLIAMAGGLTEFAEDKHIVVMRNDTGQPASLQFNYRDVLNRKNLGQNVELRPGDTVLVP